MGRTPTSPSVIDTTSKKVTNTIDLGASNHIPTAIAISSAGDAWVTFNASSTLVVIDPSTNAVIENVVIGLGDAPTGIAFI